MKSSTQTVMAASTIVLLSFLFTSVVAAEVSVKSTSNGTSRVEVNGQVFESKNGEPINYESPDGSIKVNINNSSGGTPNPTATQMQEDIRKKVEEKLEATKKKRDERMEKREKKRQERREKGAQKTDKIVDSHLGLLGRFFSWWPFK